MKCLVFSDSHGTCEPMCAALRMHPDAEVIFFLGDGLRDFDEVICDVTRPLTVVAVQGNCDFYSLVRGAPVHKSEIISLEGHRIFCTHGDVYGVKGSLSSVSARARAVGADIVLFGHTHVPMEWYESDPTPLYLFNPGSIGVRREGVYSFGILTLCRESVLFSHGNV